MMEIVEQEGIVLKEVRAMFCIPEESIEVEINAKILVDGNIETVSKKINIVDVRKAIQDAEENYIDPNDTYVLTEKGKEWLDKLELEINKQ